MTKLLKRRLKMLLTLVFFALRLSVICYSNTNLVLSSILIMTANKAALKNAKFILFNLQVSLAQLFYKEQGNQIYTQTQTHIHLYAYTQTNPSKDQDIS